MVAIYLYRCVGVCVHLQDLMYMWVCLRKYLCMYIEHEEQRMVFVVWPYKLLAPIELYVNLYVIQLGHEY